MKSKFAENYGIEFEGKLEKLLERIILRNQTCINILEEKLKSVRVLHLRK